MVDKVPNDLIITDKLKLVFDRMQGMTLVYKVLYRRVDGKNARQGFVVYDPARDSWTCIPRLKPDPAWQPTTYTGPNGPRKSAWQALNTTTNAGKQLHHNQIVETVTSLAD